MLRGSPHRRSRTGVWFAALTVTSLLMLLVSRTEPAVAVQEVTSQLLNPLRSAISSGAQGIGGVFRTIGEIERLRRDNDQLRRDLERAERRLVALEEAARQNRTLRELLGVAEQLPFEFLPAAIISRDPSNFTSEIGIDVGAEDGLQAGMVVVGGADGAAAVIGTVSHVADGHARVQLVIDTRSTVIAVDQQTRALGVVEGRLGGQLVLTGVPVTEPLAEGDAVVTAGLEVSETARSRFPAGLLIGRIMAVEQDSNGLTQTAFVRPAVNFARLEQVLVITGRAPR